jgi:hypothetical protein
VKCQRGLPYIYYIQQAVSFQSCAEIFAHPSRRVAHGQFSGYRNPYGRLERNLRIRDRATKRPVRDHLTAMNEPRPSRVLGGLPRSRPHRRSHRRPAIQPITQPAPAQATTPAESAGQSAVSQLQTTAGTAARPAKTPPAIPAKTPRAIPGARATRSDVLGTAVQAAAELAEIGLTIGARTLRDALSRLPHP